MSAKLARLVARWDLIGQVDGVSSATLFGWVRSRLYPTRRLDVWAECEPDRWRSFRADLYRADVQRATSGDGYNGFSIPLAAFRWKGPFRLLIGPYFNTMPMSVYDVGVKTSMKMPSRVDDLLFGFDRADGTISGWLSNCKNSYDRRTVSVVSEGRAIKRTRACLYRPDWASGASDAFHGFAVETPSTTSFALLDEQSGAVLYSADCWA